MDEAAKRVIKESRALCKEQGGGINYEPPRRESKFPKTESTADCKHANKREGKPYGWGEESK